MHLWSRVLNTTFQEDESMQNVPPAWITIVIPIYSHHDIHPIPHEDCHF